MADVEVEFFAAIVMVRDSARGFGDSQCFSSPRTHSRGQAGTVWLDPHGACMV